MEKPPRRPRASSPPPPDTEAANSSGPTRKPPDPKLHATQDYAPADAEAADFLLNEETAPGQEPERTEPPPGAAPSAAPGDEPATQPAGRRAKSVLGDFRLLSRLGAGGMGSVYRAHQTSLDRVVAVKVLGRELAAKPTFVERFLREARIMARLDHPNILRCFGVGQERGLHYYAMDYAQKGSLESWLRQLGRLEVGDALHVALASARALEYAHKQGLIHRDIKPDNIMLTQDGVVKVADLGLVKALEEDLSLTQSGTGAGTPAYMAPEQARNAKYADARSDIYALGCTLYRLLTGALPFAGETPAELLTAKEKGRFTPARQTNADVPARLDLILDKMLAVRPEHRYQNCAELLADLEGLGLANPALGFLEEEEPAQPADALAAQRTASFPPRPAARQDTTQAPAATAPARAAREEEAPAYWYVSYKTREGKAVTNKLTAGEVLAKIKTREFNPDTQASRELRGHYRALGSYAEFGEVLRKRDARSKADRKTEKFRDFYKQIDEEEKRRLRWRWIRNLIVRVGGGFKLLLWLGIVAAICVGLYFAAAYGLRWLSEKGEEFKNKELRPVETQPAPKAPR